MADPQTPRSPYSGRKGDVLIPFVAGLFIGSAIVDSLPDVLDAYGWPIALATYGMGLFLWWTQQLTHERLRKRDFSPLVGTALFSHTVVEGIAGGVVFSHSHVFGLTILAGLLLHHVPEFIASVYLIRDAGGSRETAAIVPVASVAILLLTYVLSSIYLKGFGDFPPLLAGITGGALLYVGLRAWWPRRNEETAITLILGLLLFAAYHRLAPLLLG